MLISVVTMLISAPFQGDFRQWKRISTLAAASPRWTAKPQARPAKPATGMQKGQAYYAASTRVLCGKNSCALRKERWRAAPAFSPNAPGSPRALTPPFPESAARGNG